MATNDPRVRTTGFGPAAAKTGQDNASPDLEVRTVVGVFDRLEEADAAAHALQRDGYRPEDISVVRSEAGAAPAMPAGETKTHVGTATGAGVGAVIGGAIGLTALALTGIGPILAAGPIVAALSGALTGGAVGALVGSLAGLGVPTDRAKQYEMAVRAGGVLVAVKSPDQAAASRVGETLRRHNARDVEGYRPDL